MSCVSGTNIVNDGLVACLDAANGRKSTKGFKNLLNLSTWTLGTGGVTGFNANGSTSENQRILDTGPFGISTLVWETPSNDATSDADGGWNSTSISIDRSSMYRFSTWVRKKDVIGDGRFYLGTYGLDASNTNIGVIRKSNGAVGSTDTNFYFTYPKFDTDLNGLVSLNEWVLVVGHVWPEGTIADGQSHLDSGIWNTSGIKRYSVADCIWTTNTIYTQHRSYQYYSTTTNEKQQWYQPRIDLCDGTEPTISELIAGVGSYWYDISGNRNNSALINNPMYNSSNNGYISFDGVDDYITIPISATTGSISFWYYYNANTTQKLIMGNSSSMIYCGGSAGNGHWYNQSSDYSFALNWGNTSQWLHMCGVYDSDTHNRFYINGQLNFSSTSYSIPKGSIYYVAGGFYVAQACKFGQISTYNRALTVAEVKQNFEATRGRYGI